MAADQSDWNLLFGVIALQTDFLDAGQFAEVCSAWAARRDTPLPDLLVARGWLSVEDRSHVDYLLRRKLHKHSGDAQATLAAVTTDEVQQALAGLDHPVLRQTLAHLPPAADQARLPTVAYQPENRLRYTLTRLHGKGGIAQVWLARDADLGREVALKELQPGQADHPAARARFLGEARITAQLEHPGVVPVYELAQGTADQQPFYTMRLIKGQTLTEAIRAYHRKREAGQASPLDLRGLLGAFVGVCNAVAYAHSRRVLHRDLKGQNVVLGDFGEVIVLDWGLAKVMGETDGPTSLGPAPTGPEAAPEQTVQGQVLGTPSYMAPEQAEGRLDLLDQRTDVYGLGAILYEVLTGQPPLTGSDTQEVLRRVVQEPPLPPRQRVAAVPAALEAVCLKALAKKPGDRYASAGELAQEVQRWLAGEPVAAYPEPWTARARRWLGRHRTLTTALAAAALVAVVSLTAATVLLTAANDREHRAREQAVLGEREAREQHAEADRQRLQAERSAAEADRQRQEADNQARRARAYLQRVYDEARGTLETRKELLGANHPVYADSLTHLASLYSMEGEYARAEPLYRQAVEVYKQSLGDHHPRYAASLNNLATLYQAMGQLDKAEPLFRQAMEITRRPGRARMQPAATLQRVQKVEEAEDKMCLLANATSQNRLARLYQSRGDFTRAEQLSGQSLETEKKLFGEGHPRYIAAKLNHAAALAYQGEHQRAAAEAAAATGKGAPTGNLLYDAARVYAVCSRAAGKDAALPQARRDELSEQYAARSVQMLGQAAAAGFFEAPEQVEKLKQDEAFVPLRSRGDFRKLLEELDGAVGEDP